jgi:hypothetical protein
MKLRRLILQLLLPLIPASTVSLAAAANYYVNSQSGNDGRDGTSRALAWRTLARVNQQIFQPGDWILLKAGTHYPGQLAPRGSGATNHPICIGKYGFGALPRLEGEGKVPDTVLLRNVEFWDVRDVEITNLGTNREPWRTGVRIATDNFGRMRHIHLQNLFVHDVNGDLRKDHEGCGIFFESRGRRSYFDDLLVENCHVARTDRNGICQRNGSGPHSLQVVIRGNLLEDIGGDGIKTWGSDAPLIEHNVLRGGRVRCDDYAAGIWPFDCNDALIQFNEVSGMKGTKDGQGFDADYLCRRSVFQYNYSHDNDGGFMLICAPGNSFNEATVVRYNISQNDGINSASGVFHISGAKDTAIYNNTIYIGTNQDLPMVSFDTWDGGGAANTKFFNNIFAVDGRVHYQWGTGTNTVLADNIFYGRQGDVSRDPRASTNRAPLRQPGSGGNGFASLTGYRPRNPEKFPRGQVIPNNGGRDFFGHPVPADRPPCIGAVEAR